MDASPATRAPGPLALMGGGEHHVACQPVDRWLLEHSGAAAPTVTVVPAASPPQSLRSTIADSRAHWSDLGAAVTVLDDWRDPAAVETALDAPDVVVLTGGAPDLLVRRLAGTPAWARVARLWHDGAALSASSAGAMAAFDRRMRLWPPRPFSLSPGLGLLHGQVVVPHFDRFVGARPSVRRTAVRADARWGSLDLLGIDEHTALVSHDGVEQVLGPGRVTVVEQGNLAVHPPAPEPAPARLPLPTPRPAALPGA